MANCILVVPNHTAGYRYDRDPATGLRDYAHRIAYRASGRTIPDGYTIDHLCRNRACVNPDHLEAVTRGENVRRGGPYRRKTECIRGHALTDENRRPGSGACGKCAAMRNNAWYHRQRKVA